MIADGVENLRAIVRRRVRAGSSVIKLGLSKGQAKDEFHAWGDHPLAQALSYSKEEVVAAVGEAHLNGLKVSAHCIGDDAVRLALATGVDVVEHGYGLNDETRKMLADMGTLVVSTISQLFFHLRAADEYRYPKRLVATFESHIRTMQDDFEKGLAAGVRYALGTDLVGYPTHPQDRAAVEFQLANEWGMSPSDTIVAGTLRSAEALGMANEIGSVTVGKKADLIAVDGNPLVDMGSLARVVWVMQDGKVVVDHT
jgi:imidazolonepropionase-like amidohydrolase